jgi:DNA-binding response OmpR family regulator
MALEALMKRLARAGFNVTAASTAEEALQTAHSKKFDAITLDVRLPDFDGLELASAIRRGGHSAATPIVFVTGRVNRDLMDVSTTLNKCFFIRKPYDPVLLVRLLTNLLDGEGTAAGCMVERLTGTNGHRR